jgi:broad specificity phosphatase PhoE
MNDHRTRPSTSNSNNAYMTPPYRHLFVFVCFFVFMYLNMDTFEQAQKEAEFADLHNPETRKVIHLIRHGQALHNVDNAYNILDPPLTALGESQARNLAPTFESIGVDLVVVSPLRRTVQTALNIFSTPRYESVPIISNELCREFYGQLLCDKRRNLTEIRAEFEQSKVDFSQIETNEDTWWETTKEPEQHLVWRAIEFYSFLKAQPQRNIAVVTHHGFLRTFFMLLRRSPHSNTQIYEDDEFRNGEVRLVFI